jgi:hypothetical protein
MPDDDSQDRHPAFCFGVIEATVFYRPVRGGLDKAKRQQLSQIHQWREVVCGVRSAKYFQRDALFTNYHPLQPACAIDNDQCIKL